MDEHWDFYLFDDQGAVSSNFLNMALAEDGPVPSHGVLGLVEVTMLTPRPDGLSSDSEAPALNDLEDAVVSALVKAGAINCGRTTGRGARTLAFYCKSAPTFEATARSAVRNFPAYVCEVETKPDPDWDYYFDFLFPSPIEWERMKNNRVLEQLAKHGDTGKQRREIDHWAYFDTVADATAFAGSIVADGYALRQPPGTQEDGGPVCVQFWRIDAPSDIDDVTVELAEKARALGGDYDGWECPVER